jgi:hypothetical protein
MRAGSMWRNGERQVDVGPGSLRTGRRVRLKPVAVVSALLVGGTLVARKLGYKVGGNVVVRCRQGHLYTTIWIPGVKLKAIDLVVARFQHCPVGHHWSLVVPVRSTDLTEDERREAAAHHDVRLP